MRKFALSAALCGILGVSGAFAETSAGFVGLQGYTGFGSATHKTEYKGTNGSTAGSKNESSIYQLGFLAGYKHFFSPRFGLRFYGLLDYSKAEDNSDATVTQLGFNINADAMFNFVSNESLDFGAFGGLSFGYASNEADASGVTTTQDGLDFGLNLGFRANVAQHHGIELYARIGLIGQEEEFTVNNSTVITRTKQDYIGGLRYIYSF